MSVDIEFISERNFNSKFKNYLRDYYIYQFKHKDLDFYDKGNMTQSRMVAGSIFCTFAKVDVNDFCNLRMKNIGFEDDKVIVCIEAKSNTKKVVLEHPLSEMFKFLYLSNPAIYFLTGHEGKPDPKKFKETKLSFEKNCSRRTVDTMYRYWGDTFLQEANENIKSGSYRNDSLRIQALIQKMPGVTWTLGDKIDYTGHKIKENNADNCIECVTVDTRSLHHNPFHMLYGYCNRYSNDGNASRGEHFSLVYALILYFHLGKKIKKNDDHPLKHSHLKVLADYLIDCAITLESEERRHAPLSWEAFSVQDQDYYLYKAIEKFIIAKGNIENDWWSDHENGILLSDIFSYIARNKKKIVYKNKIFDIVDDFDNCVDRDILYEFYSSLVQHRYGIQRRQFFNVLKDISRTGIICETNELILSTRKKNTESIGDSIKDILYSYTDSSLDYLEIIKDRLYIVRYSSDFCSEKLNQLKNRLASIGERWECKPSDRIFYKLSEVFLSELLPHDEDYISRFTDMISFFAQTSSLGEIGDYINQRLPVVENKFLYKHNYIIKALNDYNLIDILYAIKNKLWVDIECRLAVSEHQYQHFVCFPIEIRENVFDGKQFLVYYHPTYRSVSSIRLDFIEKITVGERENEFYIRADLKRSHKLIKYTWGTTFGDFFEGNAKTDIKPSKLSFVISYDANNEKFIKSRICREIRNGHYTEKQENGMHCLEVFAEVVNPWDMLHWIRSYTTRILNINFIYNGYIDDVIRSYRTYQLPSQEKVSYSINKDTYGLLEGCDDKFVPKDNLHDRLFNELFSISFSHLGDILFELLHIGFMDSASVRKKASEYANLFSSGDSSTQTQPMLTAANKRMEQAEGFIKDFLLQEDADKAVFSILEDNAYRSIKDFIPLSFIEIQWLQNVIDNPLANCFLEQSEIDHLKAMLPTVGWFDINDVVVSDQFADVAPLYSQIGYAKQLRTLMSAIREQRCITIRYKSQYDRCTDYHCCSPSYIEYSKRDNRFRLRCVCNKKSVRTFNLERIVDIFVINTRFDAVKTRKIIEEFDQNNEQSLVIYFNELNNIPDQILSEFSCYKKKCIRWGNGKYRMTLYYNNEDRKEIIVRLLSYGSLITVCDDTGDVLNEIKDRLEKQLQLSKILTNDMIRDNSIESLEKEE